MEALLEYLPKKWGSLLPHRVLQSAVKYTVNYYGLALVQGYPPHFRAIPATVLLVKAAGEIAMGSPLTIFVHHAVEALLNSQHTQHLSASCLTSC